MAISRQKEVRSQDFALLLFRMTLRALYSSQYPIGSTINSMPLDSLEHCICTTTMTNIRPNLNSNIVPLGYKPQSIRMSHQGRLCRIVVWLFYKCTWAAALVWWLHTVPVTLELTDSSPDLNSARHQTARVRMSSHVFAGQYTSVIWLIIPSLGVSLTNV